MTSVQPFAHDHDTLSSLPTRLSIVLHRLDYCMAGFDVAAQLSNERVLAKLKLKDERIKRTRSVRRENTRRRNEQSGDSEMQEQGLRARLAKSLLLRCPRLAKSLIQGAKIVAYPFKLTLRFGKWLMSKIRCPRRRQQGEGAGAGASVSDLEARAPQDLPRGPGAPAVSRAAAPAPDEHLFRA